MCCSPPLQARRYSSALPLSSLTRSALPTLGTFFNREIHRQWAISELVGAHFYILFINSRAVEL